MTFLFLWMNVFFLFFVLIKPTFLPYTIWRHFFFLYPLGWEFLAFQSGCLTSKFQPYGYLHDFLDLFLEFLGFPGSSANWSIFTWLTCCPWHSSPLLPVRVHTPYLGWRTHYPWCSTCLLRPLYPTSEQHFFVVDSIYKFTIGLFRLWDIFTCVSTYYIYVLSHIHYIFITKFLLFAHNIWYIIIVHCYIFLELHFSPIFYIESSSHSYVAAVHSSSHMGLVQ